jgi:hypothetical protein
MRKTQRGLLLISFAILLGAFLYVYVLDKELALMFRRYFTEPDYGRRVCEADPFGCRYGNRVQEILALFHKGYDEFSMCLSGCTTAQQLFIPVVIAVCGVWFHRYWHRIGKMAKYLAENREKALFRIMNRNAVAVCSGFYLAFLLLMILCAGTCWHLSPFPGAEPCSHLLLDLIPQKFYEEHIIMYYLIIGILMYLAVPWMYCMFAQSAVLFCRRGKTAFFMVLGLLLSMIYLSVFGMMKGCFWMLYLSPVGIYLSYVYHNGQTLLYFLAPVTAYLISVILRRVYAAGAEF